MTLPTLAPIASPAEAALSLLLASMRVNESDFRTAIIRKVGDKWVLFTRDGKRRLGTHNSEAEAQAQERAIEFSKHRAAGGPGSGNFGHAGRPGEQGGSSGTEGLWVSPSQTHTTRPPKGKTLAKFTDADGYSISIIGGVGSEDPLKVGVERFGVMRITSPEGQTRRAGYWMNWPEPEWGLSKGYPNNSAAAKSPAWRKLSWEERAALEVKQQATAYASLKEQWDARNLGGPGSGNFGHAGRPGEQGGSTSDLSSEQRSEIIRLYTQSGGTYRDINEKLRRGENVSSNQTVQVIEHAFATEARPLDDVVYRGIAGYDPEELGLEEGQEFSDRAFLSVADKNTAMKFAHHGEQELSGEAVGTLIKINAKGTPALDLRGYSRYGEEERLLPRDLKFKVTSIKLGIPGEKLSVVTISVIKPRVLGGPGSGNFGHAGRPGEQGGSASIGDFHVVPQSAIPKFDPKGHYPLYHFAPPHSIESIYFGQAIGTVDDKAYDPSASIHKLDPNRSTSWTRDPHYAVRREESGVRFKIQDKQVTGVETYPSVAILATDMQGDRFVSGDFEHEEIVPGIVPLDHVSEIAVTRKVYEDWKALPERFRGFAEGHLKKAETLADKPIRQEAQRLSAKHYQQLAAQYEQILNDPRLKVGLTIRTDIDDKKNRFRQFTDLGGPGSGNFGHAGRPGEQGGSAPSLEITGIGPDGQPTKYAIWKAKQEAKKAASPVEAKPSSGKPLTKYAIWKAKQEAKKAGVPYAPPTPARVEPTREVTREVRREPEPELKKEVTAKGLEEQVQRSLKSIQYTRYEVLHAMDSSGKIIGENEGSKHRVSIGGELFRAIQDPKNAITIVHNHPAESSLSPADLNIAAYPGVKEIHAITTNGSEFSASVSHAGNIRQLANKYRRIAINATGVRSYGREDDIYMVVGHLINVALHQRGAISYKAKLGPRMQQAMDRSPHTPTIKRAFGLR